MEPFQFAPDFTLPADDGKPVVLSSLRGRPVVLYFYPQDDTPGCTIESCEFRDLMPRFSTANAHVFGISPDGVASHQKFKAKFQLPFPLLADEGHHVAELYDVWKEKNMFGRTYMGVARTTFLIDAEGRIAKQWSKVKPEGHAAEVAEAVAKLSATKGT